MIINSKSQSIQIIKQLNLNRCPEIVANKDNLLAVKNFMDQNKANVYVIRDVTKPNGNTFFVKNYQEFLTKAQQYDGDFSVAVSIMSYDDIILLGDVCVSQNGSVSITCRTDGKLPHRDVYNDPHFNLKTNIESNNLWQIPHMEKLMDYITKHNLYDVIVEFTMFSSPHGTKEENIIVTELRTGY